MSVFSVPVTIGVDEEKIIKEIENDVKAQVVNKITEHIEDVIYEETYYGRRSKSAKPLKDIVASEVQKIITDKEDIIIEAAAKYLADKIARSKDMKAKVSELVEESEDTGDGKETS